eukprot:903974-Prymnesium_polylepis.1
MRTTGTVSGRPSWWGSCCALMAMLDRGTGTCYPRQLASANDDASPAATSGAPPEAASGAATTNSAARGA